MKSCIEKASEMLQTFGQKNQWQNLPFQIHILMEVIREFQTLNSLEHLRSETSHCGYTNTCSANINTLKLCVAKANLLCNYRLLMFQWQIGGTLVL